MSKLSAGQRKALPQQDFAGPGRSYPIPDANHARAALTDVSRVGTPDQKAKSVYDGDNDGQ